MITSRQSTRRKQDGEAGGEKLESKNREFMGEQEKVGDKMEEMREEIEGGKKRHGYKVEEKVEERR